MIAADAAFEHFRVGAILEHLGVDVSVRGHSVRLQAKGIRRTRLNPELCRRVRKLDLPHYVHIMFLSSRSATTEMIAGLEAAT